MSNPSKIVLKDDYAIITTSQGDDFIIDADDVPLVSGFAWQTSGKPSRPYAVRRYRSKTRIKVERLHRRILSAPDGQVVDHIDRNTRNNRRNNLRLCTPAENAANLSPEYRGKSGIAGVYKVGKMYQVKICVDGQRINLGMFETAESAKTAYLSRRLG